MATSTSTKSQPQWLALHFPLAGGADRLERLAGWCYQYSSQVCIAAPNSSLLLEIAASRRLFGSTGVLTSHICTELKQLGFDTASGIAPTPEAALVAARHGLRIQNIADIRTTIGALDIGSLNLGPDALDALRKMGFRTAGEIFQLPRKALTRRLGPVTGNYLDRLFGRRADLRKAFRPPDSFAAGADLEDAEHAQGLVFPLKRLVQELCGVLRARDRGIQRLQVCLQLHDGTENIHLDLRQVTRSEDHLMLLLRERLERLQLPCPVRHISLQVAELLPFAAIQADLLQNGDTPVLQDNSTIERLQARLGVDAVRGITSRQDHRPEHSWSLRELDTPVAYTSRPGRPGWLFPEPRPCRIDGYRVLTGPERIETGWWDGRDCRRDYFVVQDASGSTLWAFREYKPNPGWYLHGLFS
jgi:protein ImuB